MHVFNSVSKQCKTLDKSVQGKHHLQRNNQRYLESKKMWLTGSHLGSNNETIIASSKIRLHSPNKIKQPTSQISTICFHDLKSEFSSPSLLDHTYFLCTMLQLSNHHLPSVATFHSIWSTGNSFPSSWRKTSEETWRLLGAEGVHAGTFSQLDSMQVPVQQMKPTFHSSAPLEWGRGNSA